MHTNDTGDVPPTIPGARRSFITARGVRFHVTEAGDGQPVLALHGWPQHHNLFRDLLSDPPLGLRIIAIDLPGYGWSGPAPHRWAKHEVARDLLALIETLDLGRVVVIGHDWGGWIAQLMALAAPEQVRGALMMNNPHVWPTRWSLLRYGWRMLLFSPILGLVGPLITRRTWLMAQIIRFISHNRDAISRADRYQYAARLRDPIVEATSIATYRTFVFREVPQLLLRREQRRATVPIRVLFGVDDPAGDRRQASPATALADDYQLELIDGCGHFTPDERSDLVRRRLIELVAELDNPRHSTRLPT